MKTKKIIFYCLMFLPLAAALIALQLLPEQIPAHYGSRNQATRWGSKYETLIVPVFTVMFGRFFLGMANLCAKREEDGNNNEKICITAGIAALAIFNAMTGYILYAAFHKLENLSASPFDMSQLLFGLLGISMIIIGNIMPKLRMNSAIGLRTKWSVRDEATWKKSQRFGGISYIAGGAAIIVICFFAKGMYCFLSTMGVVAILLAVDIFYTYKIAQVKGK